MIMTVVSVMNYEMREFHEREQEFDLKLQRELIRIENRSGNFCKGLGGNGYQKPLPVYLCFKDDFVDV